MKFMVECLIKSGNKNKALLAFDQRGPNRTPGVTLQGAWIGKNNDVVFALVESADESLVTSAAKSWTELGDFRVTPMIDVERF